MKKNTKRFLSFAVAGTIMAGASTVAHAEAPTQEPAVIEQTQEKTNTYTVKEGDTLGKIAKRFFGSEVYYEQLAQYNHIADPAKIWVGDVIEIPDDLLQLLTVDLYDYEHDKTYTVQKGDTLYCIVRVQYGLHNQEAVDKLATYNNLCDPNALQVGQVLLIPCVEKLMEVNQNDYTEEYNRMGWRLNHPECQPWVDEWGWVWWPACPPPEPCEPCNPCEEFVPPCPPPAPHYECEGPRLVLKP